MEQDTSPKKPQTYWFVGAMWGESGDQTSRFITDGIWENGYEDRYLDLVRSMQPGDFIAIKAAYTRKHDLPFDSRGHSVSVMSIKATGIITENCNDGQRVKVQWTQLKAPREWYFFTHRGTIWAVKPGNWLSDNLIAFTFYDGNQDLARFRNAPYWSKRFGDMPSDKQGFGWTKFYQAIADKLISFSDNREKLVAGIQAIASQVEAVGHLSEDQYTDGSKGFVRDICPFTVMGLFNRNITGANRKIIAGKLAQFLNVQEPVPESFEGIPVLHNLKSWFFPYEKERDAKHIEALWKVFSKALVFADSDDAASNDEFVLAYDEALKHKGVAWNLTIGLFWVRPWSLLSLDKYSRSYITTHLISGAHAGHAQKPFAAEAYVKLIDELEACFQEPASAVHSFPELCHEAWLLSLPEIEPPDTNFETTANLCESLVMAPPYSLNDIVGDGCFLTPATLERLLDRLKKKKNLILQGPPGTGKTWLAKRLAFALIGYKDLDKVYAVQFHPNVSYEDFVRGLRPADEGKWSLADGVFLEAVQAALAAPDTTVVVVIEEINRGHPAQIFGELLTLLEADKRRPEEGLRLCHTHPNYRQERVHIPANLYVIGTMNIADRSLAMVDFALRRRFAFASLQPSLGDEWRNWVVEQGGIEADLAADIQQRITALNKQIADDPSLGRPFQVGHS